MKTLLSSLLILHVATGSIALLIGLVPMIAKKGGRLHNRAGLIYVYCMITVAITALLLCTLQPFKMMRLFLTGIAVFSFYLSMTGWRATKQKKTGPTGFDKGLMLFTLVVSLAMISFGAFLLLTKGASFFPILFTFFGALTLVFAGRDVQFMAKPVEKMHWFFQHFTRMGGSYIATFTAALVTNLPRLLPPNSPEWVSTAGWMAPTLVGSFLIGYTVRYYKIKFSGTKQLVKA